MAKGINKVILVGNIGADPEMRYMPDGTPVATLSLATSEKWKDKQSGQVNERTEWHRVVFFAKIAEIVGEYVRKGSQLYVEGQLRTRKWQDQSGQDRYTTEIVARDMQMLGSSGQGGGGYQPQGSPNQPQQGSQQQGYQQQGRQQHSQPRGNQGQQAPQQQPPQQGFDDFEDDIPF